MSQPGTWAALGSPSPLSRDPGQVSVLPFLSPVSMELIVTTFRVTVKVLGDDTHLVPSKDPWLVTPVFALPFFMPT